jgi:uncharacterized damage-inducible protein DinB
MSVPFPEPTAPAGSRAEVFLRYLDYFRSRLADKLESLPAAELGRSRLASGWTPLELAKHLRYVELRWLEWGFEGRAFADPWADDQDGRWHVGPEETLSSLLADLDDQAGRTRAIVESHDLDEIGKPGDRWGGADPATLERVLLHLLQEYARHLGQLDVVVELATGQTGELFSTERTLARAPRHATAPSRSSPRRTGSRTRPGPRSTSAARCRAAGRREACGHCPPRRACRSRSGRRDAR